MNKMFRNVLLISMIFAASLFTGCKTDLVEDNYDASVPVDEFGATLGYIRVSSLSGAIEARSAVSVAREATAVEGDSTIIATELTKLNIAKVVLTSNADTVLDSTKYDVSKYTTVGTWTSDADATETSGNAIVKMQADKTISIPTGFTYQFTINLYDEADVLVASGSTNKEISTGFNELSFIVGQATSGNGAFRIKNCFKVADRVSKVMAGIFDVETDEAVKISDTESLDLEECAIVTLEENAWAYYLASKIPAGSYIYKVQVYGNQSNEDVLLNSFSYVIQIDAGLTTYSDTKELTNINTLYQIAYELGSEAFWVEGASPVYYRNNNTTTVLPVAASMYREGYSFVGWHTVPSIAPTYKAGEDLVTVIPAGDAANAEDKTFWAEWQPNNLTYKVTLHESEAKKFDIKGSLLNDTTYVVEAPVGYDNYKWFVDNEHQEKYDGEPVAKLNIQFYDGGHHDITVHVSKDGKDYSEQVKLTVTRLPDFPITYKNGNYQDFTTGDFTGTHEETYAPVFYYGGTTVLDVPTMEYYDFAGYYLSANFATPEITSISGTDYDDEITLYAKWESKNPLKVTIPQNSIKNFESMGLMTHGSDIYALGSFDDKEKWHTYQFLDKTSDNLSANLRSNQHRTGSAYYGFYPASAVASYIDENLTDTTIVLDYKGQKQTGTTNTLASYDFMTGKITGEGLESQLDFVQLGERLNFTLNKVPADKTFKKMVLYVPDVYIPTVGVVDMTADKPAFECTETIPTDNYNHFEMELDLTSSDGSLVVSTILPPFNANGKSVILTLIDSDNNYYNAYFDGADYKAGQVYDGSADVVSLPHFVTIGGKDVATHNLGAYSPEDYGTLYACGDESVEFTAQFGEGSIPSFDDWGVIAESSTITAKTATVHGVNGIKFTAGDVELFVPANGYSKADGSESVRNTEVNLWTNTKVGSTDYVYSFYGSSEDVGVMAYSDSNVYKYGFRPFKK